MSPARREAYPNDQNSPDTLIAVSVASNRQANDQGPATWTPTPAVHGRDSGEWVATKHRWGLAVDQAEREAMPRYAANCPGANLAFELVAERAPGPLGYATADHDGD
ncbi:hypothetical protein ABT237_01820 [Streptomyces sp. NPDC001581]|uniref:hypothetical protein n=1 Tax=Streptomyces sp. NPDC001581 TaxID=3154386 RepID=UPI0033253522